LTLVEGIASGVIVSSIVEFLKGIVQQIKGKKGKVLFPKEQEKFKQAIKMSDSSELKNNPIILEISGNYNYVCIDGKYGICDKCGEMIDTDRLAVRPEATVCMTCEKEGE